MRKLPALIALASLTLCVSCGNREPERAEGGAATGAATGAAVGIVALIGGAAGAATGAATKPSDVNLGAPPWHDNTQTGQTAAKHMAN
jgi:hypothetical protein